MSVSEVDRRIRSLRPPKLQVDPFRAQGSLVEQERRPDGKIERALSVFLTGAECPFTCSFCDLWRFTVDGATSQGALTKQLGQVLDGFETPLPDRLKLYNASNFFDQRAVPAEDLPGIASLAAPFDAVTVESHASTIGPRTTAFSKLIEGRLEVAVGLETIHPVAMTQLNKRLDLGRFDSAAAYLLNSDIDLRVFVLLGVPYVPLGETIDWTRRTVEYAVARGASIVSIIPVRGGNGEMERLQRLGQLTLPTLSQLERALEACLQFTDAAITVDLWDTDRLPSCAHCRSARIERLKVMNLSGRAEASVLCPFVTGVMESCEIAIVGSGFAGSLLSRILATLGYDVVLLERGAHPRFAIGESSTPLANLSLERIASRYGLVDCYRLATHGRWLSHYPGIRRGLKRGFTFYRHHPGEHFADRGFDSERLLVAASPDNSISDTHWLRADVDHHFVREAIAAGVDYRDHVDLSSAAFDADSVTLAGNRNGAVFELRAKFLIDASGPGGFLAQQLSIPSAIERTNTRSALLASHFTRMRLMDDVVPGMVDGPYPDDWAAVHHIIDEGWMYSLRFDDGVTSAGFVLSPRGVASLESSGNDADAMWREMLARYPTIGAVFDDAQPLMPIAFRPAIQHRLSQSSGERWAMMPHAYAFVDPLFSTGIAWGLRAVERLAMSFDDASTDRRVPSRTDLRRYDEALSAEADQIDLVVAGAYEAMAHFELFAAQAMLYFAAVSFAEVSQRLMPTAGVAWKGFLGTGDSVLQPLPRESLARLRQITKGRGDGGTPDERQAFVEWIRESIASRNIAGLANPERRNLYPVDFDELVERHALLGMSRDQLVDSLPALRGQAINA